MKKEVFLLIDSHALIHRAYHAMPFLQTKSGVPSGALFGLTNMILSAIEKFQPTYIFAANDLPKTTFREMAFKDYKGHRSKTDDALIEQIIAMPKVFETFQIPLLSQEGYEADDVIGTLVKKIQAREVGKDYRIVILTGDMDIMQLVDGDKVVVYTGKKGEEEIIFDEKEVFKKHGLSPKQIPDYKGLRGDTSDNIPGIKGIGEKTALTILQKGENLKKVYELIHLDKGGEMEQIDHKYFGITERMFELLKNGEEDADFSRELATINCGVDVEIPDVQRFDLTERLEDLKNMAEEYSFLSIRRKLEKLEGLGKGRDEKGEVVMSGFAEVKTLPHLASPYKGEGLVQDSIQFTELGLKKAQIGVWLLNSQETNPDATRVQFLVKKITEKEILEFLEAEIKKENLWEIYEGIELPLIPILNESNKVGIKVDREKMQELLKKYEIEKEGMAKQIYELAGREFNINSPKQMGEILFTEMKVQEMENGQPSEKVSKMKKTKGGKVSTNAAVLEEMKDNHPIVSKLLKYREVEKMINTYLEPLLLHSQFDERIHTTFIQTGAQTGRFSSINPNMQNIPVRGEEGVELRKCFVADAGKVLVAADYSQIELRLAAMLSGEEYLKKVFETGGDIHKSVAGKMFRKPEDEITKEERNAAKAMNFGILYGMGVSSIKNTLKVERNVAQAFYDSYTMVLPNLMKYLKETISVAKDKGYTETLYGRKRNIPELFSNIPMIRASGERFAMNAPIQGSNADIVKYAMIDFRKVCTEKGWDKEGVVDFILQIHDEVIYEVRENIKDEVEKVLKETMENVIVKHKPKIEFLNVPISVNVKSGKNWGEM